MHTSWKLLITSVAIAASLLAPTTALADDPKIEPVRLLDACDKTAFDAQFPGLCQRDRGSVGPEEFLEEINPDDFGHNAWWFNASGGRDGTTKLDRGDRLRIVNQGGETHTFTRVESYTSLRSFTGGCIPPLSAPLGLSPFPGDCGKAIAETSFAPGTAKTQAALPVGRHHYICVLHPWMRQTVEVRRS